MSSRAAIRSREAGRFKPTTPDVPKGATKKQRAKFDDLADSVEETKDKVNEENAGLGKVTTDDLP